MTINLVERGSKTARNGFLNEQFVCDEFNNWKISPYARDWLLAMSYRLNEIESVHAEKIPGSYKADVQVQVLITIKLKHLLDVQNIQVKLVSNTAGFNQIDKRWVDKYVELWNIPSEIEVILKHYTGELSPYIKNTRDCRRMFADEFAAREQSVLLQFLLDNKMLIVSDLLKGRGELHAEWMLVIININGKIEWCLKSINVAMNYFGAGPVKITERGSIKIGKITMQRKGGDGGRETANMLQFKINPVELFAIDREKYANSEYTVATLR